RLLTGFHQVDVQVIEIERVLAKSLVQGSTALDIRLDVEDELLHGGLFVARADDLECLHQRNASGEHGRKLAAEDGDVAGVDPATLAALALLPDFRGRAALTAQLRSQRLLIGCEAPALDARSTLVAALPGEGDLALDCSDGRGCCRSHVLSALRHSTVTLLTSSRLVTPAF